jgi:hypothetical protein
MTFIHSSSTHSISDHSKKIQANVPGLEIIRKILIEIPQPFQARIDDSDGTGWMDLLHNGSKSIIEKWIEGTWAAVA